RTEIDRCCELLEPQLGADLREVISLGSGTHGRTRRSAPTTILDQTAFTQPALFVVEYALAQLWMSWGVEPEAMLGHSIGEYVAATLAGVFSLPEALRLVAARGRLMQQTPAGAMLSVALPEAEVGALLGEELSLAAVNSPSLSVVSGPPAALDALESELAARQVKAKRLRTSHAFHSALMEPVLDRFREAVAGVPLKAPEIPFLSNLTGTWIRDPEATDPDYWVRHLRSPVRFAAGVGELLDRPERVLVEVGPGRTLQTLVRQHPKGRSTPLFYSLSRPRAKRREPEPEHLLRTLGQLWLAGVTVDWTGFSARERRLRVPLPGYPFERRRYWIDPGTESFTGGLRPELRKREQIAEWFYVPYWRPSGIPSRAGDDPRRWLLLVDECGLGEEMARQLREAGETAVTVRPGEAFARLEPESYAVRPAERADYEALFAELGRDGGVPARIVHLWTVTPEHRGEPMLERSFYSLLSQVQALGAQPLDQPVELGIVSTGVQSVTGREPIWAEKAALLGPCQVIPKEYPDLRCRAIDVVTDDLPAVAGRLIAEMRSGSPDPVVAYRGGTRWVRGFAPAPLEPPREDDLGLRPQGVYLITGGLGGLGGVFARYLAEACRARLVLTTRSPLRSGRDRRRIRRLQALEELGAEVLACQADVGDEQAMRRVLDDARARFGTVHGVIHAAGIAGGGVIQLKERETAAAVLQPKVAGVRVLERVLDDQALDFLLLCSSTTALVAELGQVDYCAANNVLDAFAREYQARRPATRTVAVNWGPWEEVGMAAAAARARDQAPPLPAGRELSHPLLDRRLPGDADKTVYATELRAADHWVLSEHLILSRPTVPGTTWLEMARAAFADRTGAQAAELRDVLFLMPLAMNEDERREVRTILEKDGDGFEFRVVSRFPNASEEWLEHARGRVAALPAAPARHWDVGELTARCSAQTVDGGPPADSAGDRLVVTGPRWRTIRRIHLGRDEALARLELAQEVAGDLEDFGLHPALLDVATGLCRELAEWQDYLPASYHRVAARRPIPRILYGYVCNPRSEGKGELVSVDVTLLDAEGEELATIERFTMKRVGDAAERLLPPAAEPVAAAAPATLTAGIAPDQGVEALRRILARRPGPQVAASAIALEALLEEQRRAIRQLGETAAEEPAAVAGSRHQRPALATPYAAPRNQLEERLAEIWQQLLGIEQVGVDDDFLDLGGHSLMAMQIYSRLQKDLGVELPLSVVFEAQTVAEMAARINEAEAEPEPQPQAGFAVVPVAREARMPVSFSQRREWFLEQLEPGNPAYKITTPMRLEGPLHYAALEAAVHQVVRRHETMRTTLPAVDGQPFQVIAEELAVRVPVVDLNALER
ncbi:MAG: SDR family NAD(P)-dependent oxidoreductase, partial [bacterium]|nr:SDR family NAD(P)-dependent oxidoreductase [bacterium]